MLRSVRLSFTALVVAAVCGCGAKGGGSSSHYPDAGVEDGGGASDPTSQLPRLVAVTGLTATTAGGKITLAWEGSAASYIVVEGPALFQFQATDGDTYATGDKTDGYEVVYAGGDVPVALEVSPGKDYTKLVYGVYAMSEELNYSPVKLVTAGTVTEAAVPGARELDWVEFGITGDAPVYQATDSAPAHPGKRFDTNIYNLTTSTQTNDEEPVVTSIIYLYGGYTKEDGVKRYRADLWLYSHSTKIWTFLGGDKIAALEASATSPGARHSYASYLDLGGYLWLYGGVKIGGSQDGMRIADLYKINVATGAGSRAWSSAKPGVLPLNAADGGTGVSYSPGARSHALIYVHPYRDEALYLNGGRLPGADTFDFWSFTPSTGVWTLIEGAGEVIASGVEPEVKSSDLTLFHGCINKFRNCGGAGFPRGSDD